jgi:hypothetical protein
MNSYEKIIDCVKSKLTEKIKGPITKNISNKINSLVPTLGYFGGKRRLLKTRKAKKSKKIRKTLSKHKKSLRKILKHKSRRRISH